jgi:hypothetical protein
MCMRHALCALLFSSRPGKFLPREIGQNYPRRATRRSLRSLDPAHRDLFGKTYSRQSQYYRSKHAWSGLGHRSELHLQCRQARRTDADRFGDSVAVSEPARRPPGDSVRLGEVGLDRLASARQQPDVHALGHSLQNHRGYTRCQGASEVRRHRRYRAGLLLSQAAPGNRRREILHRHRLPRRHRHRSRRRARLPSKPSSVASLTTPGEKRASFITCFKAAAGAIRACPKHRRSSS